ncbi:MAG: hypothetical protein QM773_05445 [Hyphomonadaceae bacterium]
MRLGFGLLVLSVCTTACSDDRAARVAAEWGCGPVEGIKAISGERAPAWILVGEMTETVEAPAAITDIACNLAAGGEKLFVGVQDYFGGATDAETKMLADLEMLARKGAPIVLATIGGEDHPYAVYEKSRAEKAWAKALTEKVVATGARHALLFVSRADAISEPIPPSGERFAGYSPMPVFLEGSVISLEVAGSPFRGASGPAVRIHPRAKDGFSGVLALASLTRPAIATPSGHEAEPEGIATAVAPEEATEATRQAEIERMAQEAVGHLNGEYAPSPPVSEEERAKLLRDLFHSLPQAPE